MIITIDGPAGVGKSTIARFLAKKLNFSYFDTGAMYRAATYALIKNKINPDQEDTVQDFLKNNFHYEIKEEDSNKFYFVNGENVTQTIRSNYVTSSVSVVASKKYIREILVPLQRSFVEDKDIVCEGRDMGTVVFPNAEVKIYLTAKATVRAERRFKELIDKFPQDIGILNKNQILLEIQKRDELDSTRKVSPLRKAKDACLVDTSNLSIQQVIKRILKIIKKQKRIKLKYRIIRWISKIVLKTFYQFKVYGKENIVKGAAFITSNHVSFFDPPIITVALDEELYFLARESLFKVPIFKTIIRALNARPLSEKDSNIQTIKEIKNLIKRGKKIVIFPEGTRSHKGGINKLLPGVGFLINLSKCKIIPVYIHGAHDVWPRNKKFPKLFGKISLVCGKAIEYEEFEKIDKKERISFILTRIEKELNKLENWARQKL